jgi:hypothetical protein
MKIFLENKMILSKAPQKKKFLQFQEEKCQIFFFVFVSRKIQNLSTL